MKIRLLANVAKPQLPAVANRTAWKIPVGLFVPIPDWRSRPTGSDGQLPYFYLIYQSYWLRVLTMSMPAFSFA